MYRASTLLTLAGAAALVAAQGYASECTDITYNDYWLVATCPTDDGEEITSSVFLANKIGNNDGNLDWATNGEYRQGCSDCSLVEGKTLSCSCLIASRPSAIDTTLDLEEHIANYNGHLLSNQTGAIATIPANSSVPVPSDFSVVVQVSSTNNSCSSFGGTISMNDPTDCYFFNLGVDVEWLAVSTVNNQGWEIGGFTDEECTTEQAVSFTSENDGECVSFATGSGLRSFSAKPLWNADY
ncbi:Cyanovirin-N [Aspergillus insuetus]